MGGLWYQDLPEGQCCQADSAGGSGRINGAQGNERTYPQPNISIGSGYVNQIVTAMIGAVVLLFIVGLIKGRR